MAHQQQKFHTNGSSALKTEEVEYDIFVKPQFLSARSDAHIIDLTNAYDQPRALAINQIHDTTHTRFHVRLLEALRRNRLFGDLFTTRQHNSDRREDLAIFAKGFSVTGITVFFLILFGA